MSTSRSRAGSPTRRVAIARLTPALMLLAVAATTVVPATAQGAPAVDTWMPKAPKSMPGWRADFIDNFPGKLNTKNWGRYHGGHQTGTHSSYSRDNAQVDHSIQRNDGVLKLTTKQVNGRWTAAGLSSGRGFAAVRGKWVIKAKFQRAHGVGYVFLLYPKGGGWPPEIDIAEGVSAGAYIMSTFHYGKASQNFQQQRWLRDVDMTKWHTYGVETSSGRITFSIDGRAWGTIRNSAAPKIPMWIGMQTGVKDCTKSTGECLSRATPKSSAILIDWVAHYKKVL
jgi:beta-glucanase (GH16 family)